MKSYRSAELPVWLWLWLPLVVALIFPIVKSIDAGFYHNWFESEQGFLEWGVPVVLIPGIYLGIRSIAPGRAQLDTLCFAWMCLVILGSIYFAGEELSWGQHLFFWSTPESIKFINDQNETNLHNMSSWFDQKPRLLLEIWVLIGGVLLPISRWINGIEYTPKQRRYWFWPGVVCFPSAVVAILIKLPERVKDVFGLGPYGFELRWSEVQELYFAAFLSLYLISIRQRLKSTDSQAG